KPAAPPPADKSVDQGAKGNDKHQAAKAPQAPATQAPPGQTSPSQQSSNDKSATQKSASQKSENEYRPTLRRGKPTQSPPPEEVDAKTGTSESPVMGPIKFIPAISDDGGPEPRSYKFYWKTGEEEERRNQ